MKHPESSGLFFPLDFDSMVLYIKESVNQILPVQDDFEEVIYFWDKEMKIWKSFPDMN